MKLALFSLLMFASLAQARVCTTSENLLCGIAPFCISDYTITCSDGVEKKFHGVTGPVGLGKGAYPDVKKWTVSEGLSEKKVGKKFRFFYDNSEKPEARYCVTEIFSSSTAGIDGQSELHNIYVTCPYEAGKPTLYKLVTQAEVDAKLETLGYKNISTNKAMRTQYYRHSVD